MPSLSTARRIASIKNNGARTIGEIYKEDSDWLMDYTWENDIQSKKCYIYDYEHDDFFVDEFNIVRSLKEGMTYEHTNKTCIDAKFIVKTYQSMDKDQVEYYIQFRPNQKMYFDEGDELYYFEKLRKRYNSAFPIGLFLDIPDDAGRYHKWLVCRAEPANQFPKYLILPVDYELTWIELDKGERIKRRMWAVLRMQSSYTIGTYTDRVFTRLDNQNKIWLPMNSITEKIWYTDDESKNMRLIISTLSEHPTVWRVTKCENIQPFGIQKITIYSDSYNKNTDYVNLVTGEMYADYYSSSIQPEIQTNLTEPSLASTLNHAKITASTYTIKIGGSYKTLTVSILDENNVDISEKYSDATFDWSYTINGENTIDDVPIVTWLKGNDFNKKKVKFCNDRSYLSKVLEIECTVSKGKETLKASVQFELIM